MDALICPVIVGNRRITESSSATSLTNPVLTRAEGYFNIQRNGMLTSINFASLTHVGGFLQITGNSMLTRFDFASLSYIGSYLYIANNPALTFANLPSLSQVQANILFCRSAPSFIIPNPVSGTVAPPGLTSVLWKGQLRCRLQNGTGACNGADTCP